MSEKTRNTIERYIIPALLAIALLAVSIWATRQKAKAEDYKAAAESMYTRSYGELTDDLYELETTLSKLMAVNSPAQYVLLLDEVWRLSGSAVNNMSHLPVSHVETAELNQFVVRLGDYAHALTTKAVRGGVITNEDSGVIAQLRDSCAALAAQYGERYSSGDIPMEMPEDGYFTEGQYKDQESISEFPTLIYDGPFSESSEKLQPRGLFGGEVSQEQAKSIAEYTAGVELSFAGTSENEIPAYDFSFASEEGEWAEASVTRQGGKLLWYMSSCAGDQQGKPDDNTAQRYRDIALRRLSDLGYNGMTATYAQYYGGAALINCAAQQDGVILYNDLIKVWVDRETEKVCGIDARNYLFSHVQRELPSVSISREEAESMLSASLTVKDRALALIPVTPETERLCHEFKCTLGQDSYIVYIDVLTGEEQQIFKIIDSEDGQLVI